MNNNDSVFIINKCFSLRQVIQLFVLLLTVVIGIQFTIFIHQILQSPHTSVIRPPGVEAFLPIGALTSWKLFFISGHWDKIHPASMVIFGFAVVSSFILRKAFCGWICPIGTVSEWLGKLSDWIRLKSWKLHKGIDIPLRSIKYLLLGFFLWIIIIRMPVPAIEQFLSSPYYKVADAKMLYFFIHPSTLTIVIMVILIVLSFKIKLFWCRYLCPYGAFLGFFSMLSPMRINRNTDSCTNCEMCSKKCPCHLLVSEKKQIISAECIGCLECAETCPENDTLTMSFSGFQSKFTAKKFAIVLIGLFLFCYYTAQLTGRWHSDLKTYQYYQLMKIIDSDLISHPRYRD